MKARSSGVVSLLELLKFNADLFVTIARKISFVETVAKVGMKSSPQRMGEPYPFDSLKTDEAKESLIAMENILRELSLDSAEDQVKRLRVLFASEVTMGQVFSGFTELQNRIDDQLARREFYQLDPRTASYFTEDHPFGEEVSTSFPSAAHDISEAGKCYACDRFDATVFHLMLAIEVALRSLARKVRVKYSPNWMTYLDQIDKALKVKSKKTTARKARLRFLGKASSLLRAVKEAWRDESMHMGSKYGPDQTRDILNSVRAFMLFLSTELGEKRNL